MFFFSILKKFLFVHFVAFLFHYFSFIITSSKFCLSCKNRSPLLFALYDDSKIELGGAYSQPKVLDCNVSWEACGTVLNELDLNSLALSEVAVQVPGYYVVSNSRLVSVSKRLDSFSACNICKHNQSMN